MNLGFLRRFRHAPEAIRKTVNEFKHKTRLFSQSFFLSLLSFLYAGVFSRSSTSYADLLGRGGVFFPKKDLNPFELAKHWSKCFELHSQGNFELAKRIRHEILETLYEYNNLEADYFPPILSDQFFGVIGHHAYTATHIAAQKLNIIPTGTRYGIIPPSLRSSNFIKLMEPDIHFINFNTGRGWTELPNNWHLAERPQAIRGHGEFIEAYDLIDRVYKEKEVSVQSPLFQISDEYEMSARDKLKRFGLGPSDWFVGLHIRDGSPKPALRNQKISNYFPALEEITNNGGWVIRIGDEGMPRLPRLDRVIDLVAEEDAGRELHLFVLAKSRFFLGSNSGPQFFPPLFGVPTLFTNAIAIGFTTLTFSKNSIHIPKKWEKPNGSIASLAEILDSPFGWGQYTLEEFQKMGIDIKENSAEEIRQGALEMISTLDNPLQAQTEYNVQELSSIRANFPWTSSGFFSQKFIEMNEGWLNS